uniref:Putative mitochondrial protein AtMg00810 n=1 Tax=Lygus hesperus TaxID=30085 RepID=A0A0A9Y441_LYGHE
MANFDVKVTALGRRNFETWVMHMDWRLFLNEMNYWDMLMLSKNPEKLKEVKDKIKKEFKTKDMGRIHYCLGIEFEYEKKGEMHLSQKRYILEILKKYGMEDCKPISTPLEVNTKFDDNPT